MAVGRLLDATTPVNLADTLPGITSISPKHYRGPSEVRRLREFVQSSKPSETV